MGIGKIFGFGKKTKGFSERDLNSQMVLLDQEQGEWKRRVRQLEAEKEQLTLRGVKSTDQREKVDCARKIERLNANIKHYDELVASLERQKKGAAALVRTVAIEGGTA